jgi:hypothetical protein
MDARVFVDAVIAITLLEAAWLVWRRRRGPWSISVACTLASGLCLMLALRAALSGVSPTWIIVAVSAAGLAHGADLAIRTRASPRRADPPG